MSESTSLQGAEQDEANSDVQPRDEIVLDQRVISTFENASRVQAWRHGTSLWTTLTAKVDVKFDDGTSKSYFLKYTQDQDELPQMKGEYESMAELFRIDETLVPKPYAWDAWGGTCKEQTQHTSFFLSEFLDLRIVLPDKEEFCRRIAGLHRNSESPTGKFGFWMRTFIGKLPQRTDWDTSWARSFTKLFEDVIYYDRESNGQWQEMEQVAAIVIAQVIPKLLGALQENGRVLKPCLIHGDLWHKNVGVTSDGAIKIFDSGAYYGHNEVEIASWRCKWDGFRGKGFIEQYLQEYGASEPIEQLDDRARLYAIRLNLVCSAHHSDGASRKDAYDDMCYLVTKYTSPETGSEANERGDGDDLITTEVV